MEHNQQPSQPAANTPKSLTAAQVQQRTKRSLIISGVIVCVMSVVNIGLVIMSSSKTKALAQTRQQIETTKAINQDLDDTTLYLTNNESRLRDLIQVVPKEPQLVQVLQTLENVSSLHGTSRSIVFTANAPAGMPNQKYLPFEMEFTTDITNLTQFLSRLEKLPYLIEISTIDIQTPYEDKTILVVEIQAKLYVQDPFN